MPDTETSSRSDDVLRLTLILNLWGQRCKCIRMGAVSITTERKWDKQPKSWDLFAYDRKQKLQKAGKQDCYCDWPKHCSHFLPLVKLTCIFEMKNWNYCSVSDEDHHMSRAKITASESCDCRSGDNHLTQLEHLTVLTMAAIKFVIAFYMIQFINTSTS